jgi:hypothetical protein
MNKSILRGVIAVAGAACAVTSAMAQAPATAQVWDVRFVVDSTGAFAAGPSATQVGITMYARVGILANNSATGTTNLGISRVGGSTFRMTVNDALSAGSGLNQGSVAQGNTTDIDGLGQLDTSGNPLAGHFAAFRGSFAPQVGPNFVGANSDPANGGLVNPATGSPFVTNVIGSRALNFGAGGLPPQGVASFSEGNLVGDLVPVYRVYYFPRADFTGDAVREVSINVTNMSARYIHTLNGGFGTAAPAVNLPNQSFRFQIPTPGATALVGMGALAMLRRRR